MACRTILVAALALAPIALAIVSPPACAPGIERKSAYPSGLDKHFSDPTIGIRG